MNDWPNLILLAADQAVLTSDLTPAGWAIMCLSIGSVVALVSYCMFRVLTLPPVDMEEIRGPLGTDTGDTDNAD